MGYPEHLTPLEVAILESLRTISGDEADFISNLTVFNDVLAGMAHLGFYKDLSDVVYKLVTDPERKKSQ